MGQRAGAVRAWKRSKQEPSEKQKSESQNSASFHARVAQGHAHSRGCLSSSTSAASWDPSWGCTLYFQAIRGGALTMILSTLRWRQEERMVGIRQRGKAEGRGPDASKQQQQQQQHVPAAVEPKLDPTILQQVHMHAASHAVE